MNLERILVATNLLDGRDAAFERALSLAQSSGAELYVLHAVPANQRFSFRAAERLQRMADMRKRAEDAGVRVQTVEQHGDPARTIQLHANSRAVDLIVMGGEAPSGWGSRRSLVAEKTIRRANVPTLVVASDAPGRPVPFRYVLVAVDLSPASKDVLTGAVRVVSDEAVQMTLLHVKTAETAPAAQTPVGWMVPEYRERVLEEGRRALEGVVSATPAAVDARVQISTGSAARTILEHAAAVDADLVVVGRSRGFKMLGSTALRILRKSDRALLVIPDAAKSTSVEQQHAA